jgi:hypothetical protein
MDDVSILDGGKLGRQSADGGNVEFVLVGLCETLSALCSRRIVSGYGYGREWEEESVFMHEEGLSVAGLRG